MFAVVMMVPRSFAPMPKQSCKFLMLTGAVMSCSDALYAMLLLL